MAHIMLHHGQKVKNFRWLVVGGGGDGLDSNDSNESTVSNRDDVVRPSFRTSALPTSQHDDGKKARMDTCG
jgi:hypothetical protein